ncbi:MAG TPA: hypothetical protein VFC63_15430 [Blastocatellia bacterium]|nr:hypothetical protein [Blastocatellia bacterium]
MTRLLHHLPFLFVLIFLSVAASALGVQQDQVTAEATLQVQTADGRSQFKAGEVIPLKLSFKSTSSRL